MKLYAFIQADRGRAQKGSNKEMCITLRHETKERDYTQLTAEDEITIVYKYNNGKPFLAVHLPQGWAQGLPEDVSPHKGPAAHYVGKKGE